MEFYVQLQTPTIEVLIEAEDSVKKKDSLTAGFKRYESKKADEILKQLQNSSEENLDNENKIIKDNIIYLKNVTIDIYDNGDFKEKLVIKDTRNPPVSPFWENADQCLSALVDHFLASTPWKVSFSIGFMKSLANINLDKEAKIKNL